METVTAYYFVGNTQRQKEISRVETGWSNSATRCYRSIFLERVEVIEYSQGVTYCVRIGSHSLALKSSSLEELWEMYKAAQSGKTLPPRRCNFLEDLKATEKVAKKFGI